jgi:hypothetical protein
MENKKDKIIPDQQKGSKLDTASEVKAESLADAQKLFRIATERLMNVNRWDEICGAASAVFRLTDAEGKEIPGPVTWNNYFKIDVPGPGPVSGEGFDWVKVEAIEDKRNPGGEQESVTIRVRPAPSPLNAKSDTAHFFSEDATSSFRVERNGNTVRAEVHGRNEVPNTDTEEVRDKVRNAVVGIGAVAGMSTPQWKSLVNGLLDQKGVA